MAPETDQVYARWSLSADAAVPEPASLTLRGLGLAGMGCAALAAAESVSASSSWSEQGRSDAALAMYSTP